MKYRRNPAYDTATVVVSGATETDYMVEVPAQGNNTFSSFIMYLVERDVEVIIPEVRVHADAKDDTGGGDDADSDGNDHNHDHDHETAKKETKKSAKTKTVNEKKPLAKASKSKPKVKKVSKK